ncbi:MAG: hypothetical protein HQK83_11005, partial [Fibrobacteria bacterium]|nr:hypothetical protein [Fibrobacteria bacterium]
MKNQFLIILGVILTASLFAGVPTDKMMLMDVHRSSMLSGKYLPSNTCFSYDELNDVGINAILIRDFDNKGYTKWEYVNEAHEHGFWVAGFPLITVSLDFFKTDAVGLALSGVDFMQLDVSHKWGSCSPEDLTGWSFKENDYKQVKAAVAAVADNIPIIPTDVNCNHIFFNWSSLDGIFNEIYADNWYDNYLPSMINYKKNNPSKFVGNWIWLLTYVDDYQGGESPIISDEKFEFWTRETYNKLDNVSFFIFNQKANGTSNKDNGVGWDTKGPILKKITGGGKPMAEWQNFTQSSEMTGAPDLSVQVRHSKYGMDTSTVQCFYSVEQNKYENTKWVRHLGVTVTAPGGINDWITIKANRVPVDTVATGSDWIGSRIRFKIKDRYAGNGLRSARYLRKDYPVSIKELGWTELNIGSTDTVTSSSPDLLRHSIAMPRGAYRDATIKVKNSTGLDPSTVLC